MMLIYTHNQFPHSALLPLLVCTTAIAARPRVGNVFFFFLQNIVMLILHSHDLPAKMLTPLRPRYP